MAGENYTTVTKFILLGFTDDPVLQSIIFMVFLVIYITTLVGNLRLIVLIRVNPHLHTPMYFFLSKFSFVDLCHSSAITPKAMQNFLSERKSIPYMGCAAQMFFFTTLITTECFLLAVMAYDRYVAICNPHVPKVGPLVGPLVAGSYILGITGASVQTSGAFQLSFHGSNVINHFFCDIPAVIKLSCSSTYISEMVLFIFCGVIALTTFPIILVSYIYILTTIRRIRSTESRCKAFSTCTSHLTAITVFYGTAICIYGLPQSKDLFEEGKIISVFYTLVIPMLNPLIYSLRNKEVKDALTTVRRKILSKILFRTYFKKKYPIKRHFGMDRLF